MYKKAISLPCLSHVQKTEFPFLTNIFTMLHLSALRTEQTKSIIFVHRRGGLLYESLCVHHMHDLTQNRQHSHKNTHPAPHTPLFTAYNGARVQRSSRKLSINNVPNISMHLDSGTSMLYLIIRSLTLDHPSILDI